MPVTADELRKEFISIRDDAVGFLEAAEAEAGDAAKWHTGGWDELLPQGEALCRIGVPDQQQLLQARALRTPIHSDVLCSFGTPSD